MNKVIAIHLHGTAFQLEEGGYETLRTYLDNASRQLDGNPDKTEILADIEQAIADKFTTRLTLGRNVVLTTEVEAVVAEIGPVSTGAETAAEETAQTKNYSGTQPPKTDSTGTGPKKRLYRITEGAMLAGVCNGLAAYLGIDVTLLRLAVAILVFFSFGTVAIAYIVAIIIVPKAETIEQKSAAAGPSPTAQEFIRKAKEGYYEGFKTMGDRETHRAWRKKFKNEMRDWNRRFRQEFRWGAPCQPPPSPPLGSVTPPAGAQVVMPLLATLRALLILVFLFAALSLVSTGAVFGVSLPGGLPVWAGVIILFLIYQLFAAPIKALRHTYYCQGQCRPYCWHPFADLAQALVTVCVLALGVWAADRFMPGFHQALLELPEFLRNAADHVQQWWAGH